MESHTSFSFLGSSLGRAGRGLALALLLGLGAGISATAQAEPMPRTGADVQTLIQGARDKAVTFRKEAEEHRAVAKEYRNGDMTFDATGHVKPMALRIAKQHDKMAAEADKMAADADKLAGDYEMLAKELDKKK